MRSRAVAVAAVIGMGLVAPATASAVGPSPGVATGGHGAAWAGHGQRFVTLDVGRRTLVERRGREPRSRVVRGRWGVPEVAYDGSTEQVPPRSGVLVLARSAATVRRTQLLVLSARTLRIVRRVTLRGPWAFDALSPTGTTVFLIQHPLRNLVEYEVRAYDLRSGRLVPGVIADRTSGEWRMQGTPQARLQRPGGAWSYTLYGGGEYGAFVHALDTATATARCIDLPALGSGDVSAARLRLTAGGTRLLIVAGGRSVTAIDTRTLRVVPVRARVRAAAATGRSARGPWLAGLAVALAAAVAVGAWRRMPHNPAHDERA